MESMKRFAEVVDELFSDQYLRCPTKADLERIMTKMGSIGFPGCMGSIDCQHWQRRNCPAAYHGQYIGKFSKRILCKY